MSHRILIVDQDRATREDLSRFLSESLGYQVSSAVDGSTALKSAMETEYDLIILSTQLPDLSGSELYTRLKSIGPDIQAIFLAGDQETDETHRDFLRFSVPAERVLAKPVEDLAQITRLMINILGPPTT